MNNFTKSILYSATVLAVGLVAIYTIYNNVSSSPNAQIAGIEPASGEGAAANVEFSADPAAAEAAPAEEGAEQAAAPAAEGEAAAPAEQAAEAAVEAATPAEASPVQQTIDAAAAAAEQGKEVVDPAAAPAAEPSAGAPAEGEAAPAAAE